MTMTKTGPMVQHFDYEVSGLGYVFTESQLLDAIDQAIECLERHERREWFQIDGVPVTNPHPVVGPPRLPTDNFRPHEDSWFPGATRVRTALTRDEVEAICARLTYRANVDFYHPRCDDACLVHVHMTVPDVRERRPR